MDKVWTHTSILSHFTIHLVLDLHYSSLSCGFISYYCEMKIHKNKSKSSVYCGENYWSSISRLWLVPRPASVAFSGPSWHWKTAWPWHGWEVFQRVRYKKKKKKKVISTIWSTHTFSVEVCSCPVLNISSAYISTISFQDKSWGLRVSHFSSTVCCHNFLSSLFFSLLTLWIPSAPSICTFQCLHCCLISSITACCRSGCPKILFSTLY